MDWIVPEFIEFIQVLESGTVPEIQESKRPNKIKTKPNKVYVSVSQQKAVKR